MCCSLSYGLRLRIAAALLLVPDNNVPRYFSMRYGIFTTFVVSVCLSDCVCQSVRAITFVKVNIATFFLV